MGFFDIVKRVTGKSTHKVPPFSLYLQRPEFQKIADPHKRVLVAREAFNREFMPWLTKEPPSPPQTDKEKEAARRARVANQYGIDQAPSPQSPDASPAPVVPEAAIPPPPTMHELLSRVTPANRLYYEGFFIHYDRLLSFPALPRNPNMPLDWQPREVWEVILDGKK